MTKQKVTTNTDTPQNLWTPVVDGDSASSIIKTNLISLSRNEEMCEMMKKSMKYCVIDGVCYLGIGEDVQLDIYDSTTEDDVCLTEGMTTVVLCDSTLEAYVHKRAITGVVLIVNSSVHADRIHMLKNSSILNTKIVAGKLKIVNSKITASKLNSNTVSLAYVDIEEARMSAVVGITLVNTHKFSILKSTVKLNSAQKVGYISIDFKYYNSAISPLPKITDKNISININTRIDYGNFSGFTSIPFFRSGKYGIVIGKMYIDGDVFTNVAQRYCDDNNFNHYSYNGQEMITKDIIIDKDYSCMDDEYSDIINVLSGIAINNKSNNYRHDFNSKITNDMLHALIHQIRARINTFKEMSILI